jgi:hypothetical protein
LADLRDPAGGTSTGPSFVVAADVDGSYRRSYDDGFEVEFVSLERLIERLSTEPPAR